MAGPDPRRSSRARTSQPQSRPSSTTSSTSGRPDRSSKPFVKTGSPQKSTSTASLTSETPDDSAAIADDSPPPQPRSRRATQAHNIVKDDSQELSSVVVSEIEMLNDGDEIQEDDEAVRCICGYEEYPGPPSPENLGRAAKEGFDVGAIFPTVVTEDLAGFFVQCDICKVWQHGACVGLVNDDTLPEDYYCEECRKDFHKIFPSTNGPRCSIYQPNNRRRSRTSSFAKDRDRSPRERDSSKDNKSETKKEVVREVSKELKESVKEGSKDVVKDSSKEEIKDGAKEDGKEGKSGRATSVSQSSKRRSTMNSRDAAYDEEQLRIAIEASKEDVHMESVEPGGRRSKRSRSFSDENSEGVKRPRTSSRSASPGGETFKAEDESDDGANTRNGTSKKASRSAAAIRSQQQREKSEREEKERQRAEAANKRNGRAERRRADGMDGLQPSSVVTKDGKADSGADSDPSDEVPLAARTVSSRPAAAPATVTPSAAVTSTPPAAAPVTLLGATASLIATPRAAAVPRPMPPSPETPPPTSAPPMSSSKSKGGRPTHKKKGRNQYTKEREAREEQSARSRSRDVGENGHGKSGSGGGSGGGHNSKSGSRGKGGMSSRVTMSEMKRRVAAMFDFISKTQVELAGEEETESADGAKTAGPVGEGQQRLAKDRGQAASSSGGRSPVKRTTEGAESEGGHGRNEFTELSCVEMMDCLTRDIVHWQSQFAN